MADLRTNEQIDRINEFNKEHNIEPIPYEIVDENAELEKKQAEEVETERLRIESENKANEGQQGQQQQNQPPAKTELTQAEKEKIAMELFGVTDLKELIKKSEIKKEPTPEEIEAAKDQRENEKIAFALKNGKFSKKQYENFIADAKNPVALVLAQYSKEQKELDPALTDEEIEAEFNSKHGLDEAEDSRKYKRGLKEINLLADNILKDTYSPIYKIDSEFDVYENQQLTQKQLADKLISEAPVYKQTVDEVYAGLKKIKISFGKDDDYEVEMPDEIINSFKERELNTDYAASQIKSGYTKEGKAEAAKLALIYENLPMFIKSVADKINHKRQAGTKGIPPIGGASGEAEKKKLTESQQKTLDEFREKHGIPVAN